MTPSAISEPLAPQVPAATPNSGRLATIPPVQPATSSRILELDGIRAFAILLVMFYHYISGAPVATGKLGSFFQAVFRMGWCGVDLFFVLSGFLIGGILLSSKHSERYFQTFYARRVFRIFPLYYFWIGAYFALLLLASGRALSLLGIIPDRAGAIAPFLLFFQNFKAGPAMDSAWLTPLWSLAVEEQFYLVIPLVIRFVSRTQLIVLLVLTVFAAPVLRVLAFSTGHYHFPYIATVCRADALALGVLLAVSWGDDRCKAWLRQRLPLLYAVLAVLLAGVLYMAAVRASPVGLTLDIWGLSCIDLFFTTLLLLTLLTPTSAWSAFCRWPAFRNIGQVSYCMYVIHLEMYYVFHQVLLHSQLGITTLPAVAVTVLAMAATWALARLSWRFFESPLLRLAHAFRY
jgi:peptidoglycan/LPS O-acetylase OafA/YrhL